MNDLPLMLNCPHCGGNPYIRSDENRAWIWVECYQCGAAGPRKVIVKGSSADSRIEAIEGWNRRFLEGIL